MMMSPRSLSTRDRRKSAQPPARCPFRRKPAHRVAHERQRFVEQRFIALLSPASRAKASEAETACSPSPYAFRSKEYSAPASRRLCETREQFALRGVLPLDTKRATSERAGGWCSVEPVTGIEPATHSLQNCCATVAPHWRARESRACVLLRHHALPEKRFPQRPQA